MELGSYTERQRQRDPLNPQQQQNRYATAFAHPPAEYSGSQLNFYQERGATLRSAFAGAAAAGGTEGGADGWPLHSSDAAADPASAADTRSNSSTRSGLNGNYSPYDVAYRGQAYADNAFDQETLQPPHRKYFRVRVLVAILVVAVLSLCFFFQRRRALQSTSRTAIDACDLDQEPACREYGFFDGFDETVVQLVDQNPATGNFLFRSSLPLAQTTGRLMLNELTEAMRKAAAVAPLQLPERFRTILISLEWGEPNGRLLEQCELAREACEARSFPQTATVHWPIYGQNVNPYSLPAHERDALAVNFTSWDGDNIDQKVQVLYRVTHNFLELPAAAADTTSSSPGGAAAGAASVDAAAIGSGRSGEPATHNTKKKASNSNRRMAANEEAEPHAEQEEEEERPSAIATAAAVAEKGHEKQQRSHPPHSSVSQHLASREQGHSTSSIALTQQISPLNHYNGSSADAGTVDAGPLPQHAAAVETAAATPLVSVVHCHHGKDRTGVIIGAYKMRFLQYTFEQVVQENIAMGQNLVESVNALMWYCLYLEKAPTESGTEGAGFRLKCFDAVAAYPHINFISNGRAPRTPPGVLPPESSVPRPLRPVDVAVRPPAAAAAATPAAAVGGDATAKLPSGSVPGEAATARGRPGPGLRGPSTRGQVSEAAPAATGEPPQAPAPPAPAAGTPFPGALATLPMAPPGRTRVGGLNVYPATHAYEEPAAAAATASNSSATVGPGYPATAAASERQDLYETGKDARIAASSPPTTGEGLRPPLMTAADSVSIAEQPTVGLNSVEGTQVKQQQTEDALLP